MSDDWIRIVPTDPRWAPSPEQEEAAVRIAQTLMPAAEEVSVERSDKIAYSAGDAVRHNLEQETTNPSKRSAYATTGLGRNGVVVPAPGTTASAPITGTSTSGISSPTP